MIPIIINEHNKDKIGFRLLNSEIGNDPLQISILKGIDFMFSSP